MSPYMQNSVPQHGLRAVRTHVLESVADLLQLFPGAHTRGFLREHGSPESALFDEVRKAQKGVGSTSKLNLASCPCRAAIKPTRVGFAVAGARQFARAQWVRPGYLIAAEKLLCVRAASGNLCGCNLDVTADKL
jgi:hypothetical protein